MRTRDSLSRSPTVARAMSAMYSTGKGSTSTSGTIRHIAHRPLSRFHSGLRRHLFPDGIEVRRCVPNVYSPDSVPAICGTDRLRPRDRRRRGGGPAGGDRRRRVGPGSHDRPRLQSVPDAEPHRVGRRRDRRGPAGLRFLRSARSDTIKGSDFLADQDAVEYFVAHCPQEIIRLEHWGCPWSRDEDGRVSQRAFGGMSVKRTVYAADKVGFHILHTLFQTSMKYEQIHRFDESFVTSLILDGGACTGVVAMNLRAGTMAALQGKAKILATGGCGRVYEFTTNGFIKTGDGMALAYRAGVALKDMEMVQFHPTCLPGTGILITEAARGEGGVLVNKEGERYMQRYLPGKMELGPRDILSRAMIQEIKAGRAFEGPYGPYLGLDLRHLGEKRINERIPMVRELAEKYMGLDPVHELIPVRPGQHYIMA